MSAESSSGARGPSLRLVRSVLRTCGAPLAVGVDEVGRGALAGPVTVGAVAVRVDTPTAPRGLQDSKLLTPGERERMAPRVRRWAVAWGVGHASNDEIDRWGILSALRVAGTRALDALVDRLPPEPTCPEAIPREPTLPEPDPRVEVGPVVLDGSYDWLRRPAHPPRTPSLPAPSAVHLVVGGDRRCAAVAGASVLAKVERDAVMVGLGREDDRYGWAGNKGYAAPDHRLALRAHGASRWHRRSWNLGAGTERGSREEQDVLVADADLVAP